MADKRYENLDGVVVQKTFQEMRQWRKERRAKAKLKDFSQPVPRVAKPDLGFIQTNREELSVTWIGHASFLIQAAGVNLLTDPVWANRMGFSRRLNEPGLQPEDLPPIDGVLISHGHYDHLNLSSLRRIPGEPLILVPQGLGPYLAGKGFRRVRELAWWESQEIGPVQASFVPAQHWTRRGIFDTNRSHWGGWIIEPPQAGEAVYFAGDSGYFRGFAEIGRRFSIGWALLPIGAYEPEWFMGTQHMNPEQAVQAFLDLGAKTMVPMHYDAFWLADDTPQEALGRLHQEWSRRELDRERLAVAKLGETLRSTVQG